MRVTKINVVHAPIQTSNALMYDTGGKFGRVPVLSEEMVKRVVTPKVILAGIASTSSQKDTQETTTMMVVGK